MNREKLLCMPRSGFPGARSGIRPAVTLCELRIGGNTPFDSGFQACSFIGLFIHLSCFLSSLTFSAFQSVLFILNVFIDLWSY